MLVIINDSPKVHSKKIRAIIGRYAWRIARDVWIWPHISIRLEILEELKNHSSNVSIIFLWPSRDEELGFKHVVHGSYTNRHTKHGLFNHLGLWDD